MDLKQIPPLFFAQEYGDEIQLYIFERGSGQLLRDTWHDTPTTRTNLGEQESAKDGLSEERQRLDPASGASHQHRRQMGDTVAVYGQTAMIEEGA